MKAKEQNPLDPSQLFYVDIPTEDCVNSDSGAWHNTGEFDTEEAALAFATKHFGADHRGRVFLVPSQVDEPQDKLEMAAAEMVVVLEAELAALRIWQSAKDAGGGLALPDDVWDGMTISIDKIEAVLRKAGFSSRAQAGEPGASPRKSRHRRNKYGKQCRK
jgi:hypothetical protein